MTERLGLSKWTRELSELLFKFNRCCRREKYDAQNRRTREKIGDHNYRRTDNQRGYYVSDRIRNECLFVRKYETEIIIKANLFLSIECRTR